MQSVEEKYDLLGEKRFYASILKSSIKKVIKVKNGEFKGTSPDIELIDRYDQFLSRFRQEKKESLLKIARIFRKAAHRIHWSLLRNGLTKKDSRFLVIV
jgi:hypothetical protein